jgi:hypothetical protein
VSKLTIAGIAEDLRAAGYDVHQSEIRPLRAGNMAQSRGAARLRCIGNSQKGRPPMLCFETVAGLHKAKQAGGQMTVSKRPGGHIEFSYQ